MLSKEKNRGVIQRATMLALVMSAISLVLAIYLLFSGKGNDNNAAVQSNDALPFKRTGVLRVGYGGFPPYTIVNPNESDPNRRVSGYAVDIVNEIASRMQPRPRIEWHNVNWETLGADMASNRFDFLADAVYFTIPRATDFEFTSPYSYFGIAAAVVRIDDNRFSTFTDLDREGISIAVAEGWTSTEYARRRLRRPEFKSIVVGEDAFVQLDEVLLGRADVALQDVPTVLQYVRAHSDRVRALWVADPPAVVPSGFLVRAEDDNLREFLNTALEILRTDGTLAQLDEKWNGLGSYLEQTYIPGRGLVSSDSINR